jgi:hypothetical protein
MANVGVAPREVRLVLLTIGLLLVGAVGGPAPIDCGNLLCISGNWSTGSGVLAATLALITILASITTIQRIVHVTRQTPPESLSSINPGGDQHP